jgi:hypothetical protein
VSRRTFKGHGLLSVVVDELEIPKIDVNIYLHLL